MPITAVTHSGQAEWFMLDPLCLEDDALMACEVERIRIALERIGASSEAA